ncbi:MULTISPECIES: stressosome-associated protein Prli42 [Bacillaceae]|uniref:Stressosome-associated protein Prli42 n=2 Tax=Metabacillus TaxID=2675233 RepID=A0ABS5LFM4_9BACI|nr:MULTISPECIES: stressosome-associated protein Prli42 [Bacillaceae]MBS2969550.1 stressosome-associated protein Prli42 [Metabacillus flavus]
MSNKKVQKIVVMVMLGVMLLTTLLAGLSTFIGF